MLKRVLFLVILLFGSVPMLWAATVTVDGIECTNCSVDITTNGGGGTTPCDQQVAVTPSALSFTVTKGQTTNGAAQYVSVKDGCSPGTSLPFAVTSIQPAWLLLSPGTGQLSVTVDAVTINGLAQNQSATITMDVQGTTAVVQKSVYVTVTYSDPSQTPAPLLTASDVNMSYGEARGIQTVTQGGQMYYKFVVPNQCNRVSVSWTSFDWIGQVDMLVKKDSFPTLAEYNSAVASGYPARSSGPTLWYSLMQTSGDGGETVTMSYVPAGIYYIMIKNTNTSASKYKVWYAPNCSYIGR